MPEPAVTIAEERDPFLDDIFPAELGEICRRRKRLAELAAKGEIDKVGLPRPELPDRALPSAELGLVGLALSGGGIRSASFNLGVIQSLVGSRVMAKIDYISTVSGGGYIGACLDTVMSAPHVGPSIETFPLHFGSRHGLQNDLRTDPRGAAAYSEPPALRHLRDGARYLAPGGLKALIVIPFLLLRGIAVNLIALLSYAAAVATFGMLAFAGLHRLSPSTTSAGEARWSLALLESGLGVALLLFIIYTLVSEFRRRQRGVARESIRQWITFSVTTIVSLAVLIAQPWAFAWFWGILQSGAAGSLPTWLTGTAVIGALLQALSLVKSPPRWARLALLTLLGLLGPLLIYAFLLVFSGWIWFGAENPATLIAWPGPPTAGLWDRVGFSFVVISVINIVVLTALDINRTSMLYFYRDRLSSLFLFRTRRPDAADSRHLNEVDATGCDDLCLSQLNPNCTVAPYHLINATVNLQGSKDKSLRGRQADFFLFSKHFVGSRRTGYCATARLEGEDPDLDLAMAVSISAAAAAPNMGSATFRPLVFVMTLLNVRLGYWLPNPGVVAKLASNPAGTPRRRARRPRFAVGLTYLASELCSRLDERSPVVNVTDGGHLENLGVYELLARRCKVIIACDAEADPNLDFASLARVIRFARTDMGIDIDLSVDRIRLDALNKESMDRIHWAVGTISYPGGSTGQFIYLKSTLVGSESLYVRQQKRQDPQFPHTPTSDQFFTEAQFECYRSLGFHIGNCAFRDWSARAAERDSPEWLRDLERC
jgi:hypothetical protein